MKKMLALILAVLMMFSLVACGDTAKDDENDGKLTYTNFVMGSGGVAGSWYPIAGALCTAMSYDGASVSVQTSAGSVENVRLIMSGEREFGLCAGSVAYYAHAGEGDYKGEDGSMLRALACFSPIEMQVVVRKDSGINGFSDLKGKAMGIGPAGSADQGSLGELLSALDITFDDMTTQALPLADQVTAFKDRQLDAAYVYTSAPTSGIMDIASQADIKMLSLTDAELDAFIEKYPFYTKRVVPAEKYSFLEEDVQTAGGMTLLICTEDVPDEIVYQMLKNLFANIEGVQASHVSMNAFNLEEAASGMTIPIHPGAEKFYKEAGIL